MSSQFYHIDITAELADKFSEYPFFLKLNK